MAGVVLIVEDDEDWRELVSMSSHLEAAGLSWRPLMAAKRSRSPSAVCHRPTLIMLDVAMPGLDGVATVLALQERPETASVPVVLLSASHRWVFRPGTVWL